MEYTPVTTGPIAPDVLERVAVKVADENFLDDDFVYHPYANPVNDWQDEGVQLLLNNGVSSKAEVADAVYERLTHNDDYEIDVASQVGRDFDEKLKQTVEEEGIDASFQDVMNQINDERANIESCVEFDWSEPIDRAWEGIVDFADGIGLSVDELVAFEPVLMPNSTPDEYALFVTPREFVQYAIDDGLDIEDLFNYMNDDEFDEDYFDEHGVDDKVMDFLSSQSMDNMTDWANRVYDADCHDGTMLIYIG